jgi:hypothetical protein
MKSLLAVSVLSAGAAFAAAGIWFAGERGEPSEMTAGETNTFDTSAPLEERIAALENAVSDERLARQLLQEEVFYLTGELERLSGPGFSGPPGPEDATDTAAAETESVRRSDWRSRNSAEGRKERLVEAGFLPAQADWIVRREQELQMEALQARFDAERSGEPVDWMANRTMASDSLRAELGDTDYERYLEASGRSTKVSVSSVIESSPAQSAGLQPGDEIVRYAGERVFSMSDLTRQTMVGVPGETVVVDIMRDGNLMQVVLPRGPVGITGGRRRY